MPAIDLSGVIPQLPDSLQRVVADLSGVIHSGADLIAHVPALAAAAQALGGSGPEKLALVQRAAHAAVDLYVPAEGRAPAHLLVDGVLPAAVRAVLDVSKGRVKIGEAIAAAAVEVIATPEAAAAATGLLSACLACLIPPRRAPSAT